jgi:hypothetical protein
LKIPRPIKINDSIYRETTHEIFLRDANGDFLQTNADPNADPHDNMPKLYVPNVELDEYENCQTIPKHRIMCARDVVQLAGIDKSSLFMVMFLLSNIYVLIKHIQCKKLGNFIWKFNSKLREIFVAKYAGRSDFSQHNFIGDIKLKLFQGLLKGVKYRKFWLAILKNFKNNVELTANDKRLQLQLTNALDEMRNEGGLGGDSLKVIAKRLGVGYERACRLAKV